MISIYIDSILQAQNDELDSWYVKAGDMGLDFDAIIYDYGLTINYYELDVEVILEKKAFIESMKRAFQNGLSNQRPNPDQLN